MLKRNHPLRYIGFVVASLVLALLIFRPASTSAQDLSQIKVSAIDTSSYPVIRFSFWPFNSSGKFVDDVTAPGLFVFENDQPVEVSSLNLVEPGTHIILAVNEGTTLGNYYAGKTRLDAIKEAWSTWALDQATTTVDDFSLVNNDSILADNLSRPAQWVDTLDNYKPLLDQTSPSMNCMSLALSKMTDLADNKNKAIMLVTPLPGEDQLTGLQAMSDQANRENIRLFIWLVGPQSYKDNDMATALKQMAETSGGAFFLYSGAETLPTVASYLDPLHYQYEVTYKTSLKDPGTYNVAVHVDQDNFQQASAKIAFELKVLPANPIFLSPPSSITRTWSQDTKSKEWSLVPTQQAIQFILEFPDGHTRALTSAQLFVDGTMVAENKAEPFGTFSWDLSPYTTSATHMLQITVVDEAGISASTILMPVAIVVDEKPLGAIARFIKQIDLRTLGVTLFLVLIAVGMVFLFLRLRLRAPAAKPGLRKPAALDEVKKSTSVDKSQSKEETPAHLLYLGGGESTLPVNSTFNLGDKSVTLGNDPLRCEIALNAPSVSPVHAEISMDAAQNFYITDRGSAAGTWVNYAPAAAQGTRLENGDMIHLGACDFRFEQSGGAAKPIEIKPYTED